MFIYLLEVELRLFDSFSLKDKRKVVKSIIDYGRNTLKISSAEIGENDMVNFATWAL